ncbi:MAG: glycosyltransferase [Campylobacterales bacterium]|nr:glycosyltransferase [Campylobacterales bacterium]
MMRPKRIVLITDTLCDANGVSRFIQDIARVARNQGYDLTAITSTAKTYCEPIDNIKRFDPLIRFKMPFYPELDLAIPPFWKLYRTVKAKNPDVIHISTPGLVGLTGLVIAKILRKPVYSTYHTDFASYLYSNTKSVFIKKFTRFFEKRFYRACQGVFIRSDIYRPLIEKEFEIDADHVLTIPAGIDIGHYDANHRDPNYWNRYGIASDATIALYVGRVSKEKNIAFLLDTWKANFKPDQNHWLILVGSGSFYQRRVQYEAYNIKFLGHQDKSELATLYPSSDFFIFPSNSDTLGQVVIEAMASGLPIVVSDQGGPQTLVSQSVPNGYVIEQNHPTKWWQAIETMLYDNEKRLIFSVNARQLAQNLSIEKSFAFFWENHVPKM